MLMVKLADQVIAVMLQCIFMGHFLLFVPRFIAAFSGIHFRQLLPCLSRNIFVARMVSRMRQPEIKSRISIKSTLLKASKPAISLFVFADKRKSGAQFIAMLKNIRLDLFQNRQDILKFVVFLVVMEYRKIAQSMKIAGIAS